MTTASATPQQMRDRLLQAVDSQSNICNMVVVLEVITYLEKYPITKEALEETRLGKLINDVRKKTKDEDLAKRAKKLLRNWQKLIEPGPAETPSRGPVASVPGSTNGGSHPCRTEASPPDVSPAGKVVPEVKIRNDVHNTYSPKAEKSSSRKRRGEHRDGVHLQAKIAKLSSYDNSMSPPPTNGTAGSPEAPADQEVIPSPDRSRTEHLENDKHARIPVNAVKPRPSSPGGAKLPSTSSLIKAAVMQQQARMDEGGGGGGGAGGGGYYQAKSPRCLTSTSPRTPKQETMSKRSSTYAPKGTPVPSPSPRGSPLPLSQSLTSPAPPSSDGPPPPPPPPPPSSSSHKLSSTHWASPSDVPPRRSPHNTAATLEPPSVSPPPPRLLSQHNSEPLRPSPLSSCEGVGTGGGGGEPDGGDAAVVASTSERKRRKKYRSRDYAVNLDGLKAEDTTKPVRLKERRLTFDPVTGQIKPMVHREPSSQAEEVSRLQSDPAERRQRTEAPAPQPPAPPCAPASASALTAAAPAPAPAPTPSPFQQTNWKELSRNEIIQSYLNLQGNVLTSSGVRAPSAHFFMSEYLKREEHDVKEARKTHVLQTDGSPGAAADLPGVSREVSDEDLNRVHAQHWPGVNGCYDTKGSWFDWTDCISLDPHGDESKLNILPYVCLD